MRTKLSYALIGALAALTVAGAAQAEQMKFDPAAYTALVAGDASQSIPEGTKITLQNWQQYKNFMPIGVQAMFSQKLSVEDRQRARIHDGSRTHCPRTVGQETEGRHRKVRRADQAQKSGERRLYR